MFKVFISYSTLDLKYVTELQQSLVGDGVDIFIAEHSVTASQPLSETISAAISTCDVFVLFWSANAKASEWVPQEIGKAHSLKKTILPLMLEDGLTLPGFIGGLKFIPVFRDPEAMLQAREIILKQFESKQFESKQAAERQREQESNRNALILSGTLLWLLSKKNGRSVNASNDRSEKTKLIPYEIQWSAPGSS